MGLLLALVLLGPALAPGPVFNLDLILTSDSPVPRGAWGLGPELPRRQPIWLVVAWLAPVLGGDVVAKVLMAACIVVAFVGAYRLTTAALAELPPARSAATVVITGAAAGLLYAGSPFMLTRLAIGHLMITIPIAVLPWVLPRLLRPGEDIARTFLAALALSLAGHYGGAICGIVILVGLASTRGRNVLRVVGVTVLAQVSWLVPGLVVYLQGVSIADATPYALTDPSVADLARVLGGHGFYDAAYQVGHPGGAPVLVAGLVLLGLALYGTRVAPRGLGPPLLALAVVGFLVAIGSSVPGLSSVTVWFSRTAVGSVLREGQRALPLYLIWAAPCAALGAVRLGDRITAGTHPGPVGRRWMRASALAVPLVVAVVLAIPGAWGIDGRLRPVTVPPDWEAARTAVQAAPGTVLALPWHQYLDLKLPEGTRRTLDPMPIYLGGDVITSSDPELQEPDRRERLDPRELLVAERLDDVRAGRPAAAGLATLGVRWVLVQHDADWERYDSLATDPGLERVIHGDTLDLYRVRPWRGLVTDAEGRPLSASPVVEPVLLVDPSGPAVYARPWANGWMRGWSAAAASPTGTVALPAGSGPVWYWPTSLVLAADVLTVVAAVMAWRRRRPRDQERQDPPTGRDRPAPA